MTSDLAGLTVLTLEQAVAAPYVSGRLARAGARVIKIEREEGDFARRYDAVAQGESAYFVWLNQGKESLVADIKDPADQHLLHRILAKADVFIQNLAPGAAARVGLDSAQLRERYPRLITCDISGYGEQGSYAERKAYDLLVQAESGLASLTGTAAAPGRVGVSVCDIAAGMHAWAGILQALFRRERTGSGDGIRVSLFDGMADWMSVPLLHHEYGGEAPPRVGLQHPSIAPYGVFTCRDGRQMLLSIQNEREWIDLCCDVLGDDAMATHPRFSSNQQRVQHREELNRIIQHQFEQWGGEEAGQRLSAARIAFGELRTVAGLAVHPQLRRQSIDTRSGSLSLVADPIRRASDSAMEVTVHVPDIGEHSDSIRSEFSG